MSTLASKLAPLGVLSAQTAIPILVLGILVMMLLPLPPIILDLLFTLNIGLSILILIAALNIRTFKDFVAFPSLLLVATLLRLSLNVASTRVILVDGHTGSDAAGKVIEAFGKFLIGGNFAVGVVIFTVITIINFVVITKGSGRVAEVSARFVLDALPGKQMAIDADLNAGIIKQEEAKQRRAEVAQEADFFGSMDGASKFVRGDAIAGILILLINIVGGLVIGMTSHDLSFGAALTTYGGLTIGDGLVAQIPALVISTAAGILVTRVSTEDVFAGQLSKQINANRNALFVAAGTLVVFGLLPGIPSLSFLLLGAAFGGLAYLLASRAKKASAQAASVASGADRREELGWADVPVIEALRLELPYRLIPIVDKGEDSDLIKRIRAIRRKFINDVGFLAPSVHIRDNLQLPAETYRFLIYGGEVGRGQCLPDKLLAIAPEGMEPMPGIQVRDPSFGMPATWIERDKRDAAIARGHTVVEPAVVMSTHLETLIHRHAHELLGREETQGLLENFKANFPKLVEDVVPKVVSLALLQRLLQLLLEEGVPIKDLRTILEVAAENAPKTPEALDILPFIRLALRRTIFAKAFNGNTTEVRALGIQPEFERLIEQSVGTGPVAIDGTIEPSLMKLLVQEIATYIDWMESRNLSPVIVSNPRTRLTLSRIAKRVRPHSIVLAMNELPPDIYLRFEHMLCAKAAEA
jgi:flagellar biosynthesis protein FlhA